MRRLFLWLAVPTLLAAAALRTWQLHAYPPGPHYDEAANLLIARSVAYGGAGLYYFPIVPNYQGREILYYYLATPLLHLIGGDIFSLRVTSVFASLVTVAASMALGRAMFGGRRGLVVGLAVGVMMALSFPQIWLARQAFRAVALPLCQALALLLLWKGLHARRGGWRWLAAGGFCAGAALYTYMASRLFPLWLAVGLLGLILLDRPRRPARLRQSGVFLAALAVTVTPLAIYALRHPDIFLGRLEEVTTGGGQAITLGESIWRHARMFFIEGEALLRYNVPGRPYFTPPEGALLLVGLGMAAARLLRAREAPTERAACLLALLSPLMVLPSVVAVGGLPPNHMRSLGMVPLIFVLAALGFEAAWSWLAARLAGAWSARLLAGLTVAVLAIGGVGVGEVYLAWAGRADLFYDADGDLAAATRWLQTQAQEDAEAAIYLASYHYRHPTVMIAALPPFTWLSGEALFWPPPGRAGLYVFPRSAPPSPAWADRLAPYALDDLPRGPDGRAAFQAFRVPADAPPPALDPPPADPVRNAYLTLVGVQAPTMLPAGQDRVAMAWRVEQPPPFEDLTPFMQVEDAAGNMLSRSEFGLIETDRWQPGTLLLLRVETAIPVGTPPGRYALRVAWVARSNDTYISYQDTQGRQGMAWATIGQLEVIRPTRFPDPSALPIQTRQTVDVAPGVRLLGWDFPAQVAARPGETLVATLYWQAVPSTAPRPAVTVEALLTGEDGQETVLWRGAPAQGSYPSDGWIDGELVTDRARWPIPHEQAGGHYTVALRVGRATVPLAEVTVQGMARLFQPPAVATEVGARLGDALRLHGYTLAVRGGALRLELAWQAEDTVEEDYTVFVHVVDAGDNIVAQQDRMPQDNGYPTSLWVAGEYVPDSYVFPDLPAGHYRLRAGMYRQADGTRLPVRLPDGTTGDFMWLGEVEIGP